MLAPRDAAILDRLIELRGGASLLAVIDSEELRAGPPVAAWLRDTYGFIAVDVTRGEDPLTPPAVRGERRLITGLPLALAEVRQQVLRDLNRRRDWIAAEDLQLLIWTHRDDVREIHETAPDLAAWIAEQLT